MKKNINKQFILNLTSNLSLFYIILLITLLIILDASIIQYLLAATVTLQIINLFIGIIIPATFIIVFYLLRQYDELEIAKKEKNTSLIKRLKFINNYRKSQKNQLKKTISTSKENTTQCFMLLDFTGTATLTINKDQNIVHFNQAAQRLFGYEKVDIIGQPISILLPAQSRENHHQHVKDFGSETDSHSPLCQKNKGRGLKRNGDEFPIELYISKVDLTDKTLFIASITDISERIHNQKKLAEQTKELQQKNVQLQQHQQILEETVEERTDELAQSEDNLSLVHEQLIATEKMAVLGEMVSSAAHEINTPIGIGVTCASNLIETNENIIKAINEEKLTQSDLTSFNLVVEESAKIILHNMERAARLVQSFKSVSTDQVTDMQRTFNLHEYLSEILVSLNPKFKNTNHKFIINCDDNIMMNSHPGALSQILTNLILNSLIHGFEHKDSGLITITANQQQQTVLLRYSDNGKGLTDEQAERLFEAFYTTKKNEGGTGLGMHIVQDLIINSLQGTIVVVTSNEGIIFDLTFPSEIAPKDT